MQRLNSVMRMLSFFWLFFVAFPGIAVESGGAAEADFPGGQVVVRERSFGVSRVDYTRCVEFCTQTLPEGSSERRTCIAGCSNIDSSFEIDGGLIGGGGAGR